MAAAFARLGCQTLLGERCGHLRLPLLLPDLKITVLCLEAEAMMQETNRFTVPRRSIARVWPASSFKGSAMIQKKEVGVDQRFGENH